MHGTENSGIWDPRSIQKHPLKSLMFNESGLDCMCFKSVAPKSIFYVILGFVTILTLSSGGVV